MARLTILIVLATIALLAATAGSAAQDRPGDRTPPPPPSGPVTTVSWVGTTLTITGSAEADHINAYGATDTAEQELVNIVPSCTFAEDDRMKREAQTGEPAPCQALGRVVVAEAGPNDNHSCHERDGGGVTCFDATNAWLKKIVIDMGSGADELRVNGLLDYGFDATLGAGDDATRGGYHDDRLTGGAGNDHLLGGGLGGDGDDVITGGGLGEAGDDHLIGGGEGGPGNDLIEGEGTGGSGNDRFVIRGRGPYAVTARGGPGSDRFTVLTGFAKLYGDGGNDVLVGGPRGDRLDGGSGRDRCDGRGSRADRAKRCEVVKNVP